MRRKPEKQIKIISRDQARALDEKAKKFLPEILLIENASRVASAIVLRRKAAAQQYAVIAGAGNNGADALAFCRHILNAGRQAEVFLALPAKRPNPQVLFELGVLEKVFNLKPYYLDKPASLAKYKARWRKADVIVDGIFGVGFRPPAAAFYLRLFREINAAAAAVVALDLPSGISAEGGDVETAVKADITISFLAAKPSLLDPRTRPYWGKVFIADIGISYDFLAKL